MLSPKENYLRVLNGDVPDYVPSRYNSYLKPMPDQFLTPNNLPDGKEFVTSLGVTYVGCREANNGAMPAPGKVVITDITKWRDQLKILDVSNFDWEHYYTSFSEQTDRAQFAVAVAGGDYFLTLVSLLGFEEAMIALYEEPEEVKALLAAVSEFYIFVMKKEMLYLKPEVFTLMDDDAAYRAPFFSVGIYREFFKPLHKLHCDIALESGCKILRHDCGKSEQFLEDWLELGIHAWNPFQITNDCPGIKKKYGDRLTLDGAWDNVGVLSYTDDELVAALEDYAATYLPGGRCVFSPSAGGMLISNEHQEKIIHDFYEAHVRNFYKE